MDLLKSTWAFWLAENMDLGVSSQTLIDTLVRNGHDESRAAAAVRAAEDPTTRAAMASVSRQRRLQKRDWVLETTQSLLRMSTRHTEIDRRSKPSRAEFLETYYSANRPAIVLDALNDWKALTTWNPQVLKEKIGNRTVEIQRQRESHPDYEVNANLYKKTIPFSEYVDMVTAGPSNDFYMTANNSEANLDALRPLRSDYDPPSEYLDPSAPQSDGFFWFGPAETVTPLHHDLTNNLLAQVLGRKLIRMIAPCYLPALYNYRHCYSEIDLDNVDFDRHPAFSDVPIVEFVLQPGELLFLPVGWWHYVRSLDVSITMSFTNFVFPNSFTGNYHTHWDI